MMNDEKRFPIEGRQPKSHASILRLTIFFYAAIAAFVVSQGSISADDATFDREVLPILSKHCMDCHSGDEKKAKLDLSSRESLLFGSDGGYVIVPGKATASLLTQLVAKGSKPHMPPDGQMTDAEIETLKKWIDGLGMVTLPTRQNLLRGRDHWAFRSPIHHKPPQVNANDWVRSPVDNFVLAKLETRGLEPSPPADRADLLRRAFFDLIGLPPSPEEVVAFLEDESPDAYEKVLDRLLASPAYGERWGRHWLDLARYADSSGFHDDLDRPHSWRYRDYVIRSLNEDKPFSDFIREQLAGDEFSPHDAQALAATGFCLCGPSNENNVGPEKEKYRIEQLDDVISTTSAVFLAQTIGCARCHDHKFDPIPQTDYYRFLAIFDNTTKKDLPLDEQGIPQPPVPKEKPKTAVATFTDVGRKPRTTFLLWRGDVNNRGPEVEPGVPVALVNRPIEFTSPAEDAKTTGRRRTLADWIASPENPLTWRVIVNRLWQHHFGRGIVATASNFGTTGAPPTHPELLDWLSFEMAGLNENSNAPAIGQWKGIHRLLMTSATYRQASRWDPDGAALDADNQLLWRMPIRRLESESIRDSILTVAGTIDTRIGGPGIKPRIPAEMLVASQRNKWPVVDKEGPQHWRRGVYVYVKRQLPFPMLELFDSPSSSQTCERRDDSTVPTQALVLMNDEFTQQQAVRFANRICGEVGSEFRQQAERALWLALCRAPAETRILEAVEFLRQQKLSHEKSVQGEAEASRQALADLCHVLMNCNEFLYVE